MKLWLFVMVVMGVTLTLTLTPVYGQDNDLEDLDDLIDGAADEDDEVVEDEEDTPPVVEVNPKPVYSPPTASGPVYLAETFDDKNAFNRRWIVSQAKKDGADAEIAKFDGEWAVEEPKAAEIEGDVGLVLKSKARHHAISTKLNKPFPFNGAPLFVQYEVRFQEGQECGGAYIKLLTDNKQLDLKKYNDKMPYTIMFGPDKCGNDHKLHFIFRHRNPKTGEYEEKHAKKPSGKLDSYFTDKKTHLYSLAVFPDNRWEVFVDQVMINSGSLLEDMDPPINPAEEITDPDDKKPEDWDDQERIADPEATKPEDWDEDEVEYMTDPDATKPEGWLDDEEGVIPDPDANKPEDWDDEMDGEWEAPMIDNAACSSAPGCGQWSAPEIKNPKYKGKWKAPKIDNPNYKGKWAPRKIANPNYFEDLEPYKMSPFSALGLELWSMSSDILFDNFLITDNKQVADQWAADSWKVKQAEEFRAESSSAQSVWGAMKETVNEKPWILAVICVVVILPLILIIVYCCSGDKKGDEAAARKKTDEPTLDDIDEEGDEAKGEEKQEGAGDTQEKPQTKPAKKGKGALEAEPEPEADAEEEEEEEEEEEKDTATRKSPRKRKPRKE